MNIKKDDNVIVITGKDKGKKGSVLKAFPKENKIVVAGVNVLKKHQKARKSGEKGQIIEKTMPIHVSNVKLVSRKDNKDDKKESKKDKKDKSAK